MAPFLVLFAAAGVAVAVFMGTHPINPREISWESLGQIAVIAILASTVVIGPVAIVSSVFVASAAYRIATDWVEGRASTMSEVLRFAWTTFGASFGALGVYSTAILVGLLACFLPGLAAAFVGAFTVSVALTEKSGGIAAFRRSVDLVMRNWVDLLIVGVAMLLAALALGAFSLATNHIATKVIAHSAPVGWAIFVGTVLVRVTLNLALNLFMMPMSTIAYHLAARADAAS